MSGPQDQSGELQRAWRDDREKPGQEDHSMLLELLREKRRSLQDLVHGQDYANYMIALSFAPLTALCVWKARPMLVMQVGYAIITVMLIAGALVTWIHARRANPLRGIDLSARDYQRQLLQLYERRIRFLKSVKYWKAIPLFFGAGLVLFPIVTHFLGKPWGLSLLAGILLLAWISVWHMHDVRGVRELRQRQQEARRLLDEMERG